MIASAMWDEAAWYVTTSRAATSRGGYPISSSSTTMHHAALHRRDPAPRQPGRGSVAAFAPIAAQQSGVIDFLSSR